MISIGVVSLGCDKNTVDTERMLSRLREGGYLLVTDPSQADVIIINTCAFIEKARKEAVDTILEYAAYEKKLIVTGCLPQKYIGEIFEEFVEVDGFLGTDNYDKINEAVAKVLAGGRVNFVGKSKDIESVERVLSTPKHFAYLKIADGCLNRCAFCTIPSIRGGYRSRTMDSLIEESKLLAQQGVKELILVAQDSTAYGVDLCGEYKIVELLQRLSKIEDIKWIRLMYCYPEKISDALIEEVASNPKICKYLDIPFQHVSDSILKKMGRKYQKSDIISLLKKLRARMPEISIRSTFMVGFPQEGEAEFSELVNFLQEHQIDNAGFFQYSKEAGTAAARMDGQIDSKTKAIRFDKIQTANQNICFERQRKKQDKMLSVVVDYYERESFSYVCRDQGNAPDIDTQIFVSSEEGLSSGDFVNVKITHAQGYDLAGIKIKED